ncbi:MAG: tetratricopeptide repeat protein [Cyclobacteriaceae bacterium]
MARDTNFVSLLNSLSRSYRANVPDTAIIFANEAYDLGVKLKFEKGIATALNFIGIGYFYKADYKKDQAYQEKALEYAKQHQLKIQTSNAFNSLAISHQYQGNYTQALECYLQALQFEEQTKNYSGQMKVLANLGTFWRRQGDYPKAIEYSERALRLADSVKDSKPAQANVHTTLGNTYINLKQFEKALPHFELALKINREIDQKLPVINSVNNLGFCHYNMDNYDKAESYFLEAIKLSDKISAPLERTLSLIDLAEVYLAKKNPARALPLAKEGFSLAKSTGHRENLLTAYKTLASIYQALGNSSTAFDYLNKAMTLNDSLRSEDVTKKVSDLQKSYELEKKEAEITLLEKDAALRASELKQEKNLRFGLFFLVGGLTIVALTIFYAFRLKTSLSQKLQHQNEEIVSQKNLIEGINENLRAQALRAQMNPHFIFNSLNSIQFLIFNSENDKAFHYLSKFARLLRKILDHSQENLITLSSEMETLDFYLQLESLRFNDGFHYEIVSKFTAEENEKIKIPPMIAQPFVENAILHGLMQKKKDRRLQLVYYREGNFVICEVIDNGIGREAAQEIKNQRNSAHESKGLELTYDRIKVLNNRKALNSKIEVMDLKDEQSIPTGTKVKIWFSNESYV